MRIPLDWLAEWIELPASEDELVEKLTVGGLEIEEVLRSGPDLSQIVVGYVIERRQHPDADRLSHCRVDIGTGTELSIVCGAPNVATGQKVAIVQAGISLPDGTRIKRSKIRGVESQGMICSTRELGLGEEHDGILVLDASAPVGAPLPSVIATGTTTLDVKITPNRGDWASLLGMAREVRAHFGGRVNVPPCDPPESARPVQQDIDIRIDDPAGCYTYVGRVVRGVQVGPSPDWLVAKLEAAGLRAINVVVDVTNLVLLELGQPLHAFDLATLQGAQIRVRRARAGEKLATLDGQTRELAATDLVIADAERAVALAGVMGGAETEVRASTRDVLIESANFDPSRVRASARRAGLHTEASYRFERGVDRDGLARAADRAARLLAELAGGSVSAGRVEVQGDPAPRQDEVELDPARPSRLLGVALATEDVVALLARVDIRAELTSQGRLRCRVPSYRNDVRIEEDLVEEVARVYGYDRIPTTLPFVRLAPVELPAHYRLQDSLRDALCAAGLVETYSYPALAPAELDRLRLPADHRLRRVIRQLNPVTEGEADLRTSLLPSLLHAARRNLDRQVERVRLFEVGPVFVARAPGELPDEPLCAAAVLTRGQGAELWARGERPAIFFEAKGVAERVFEALGRKVKFRSGEAASWLHPGASVEVLFGKTSLGSVGELHPEVAAAYGITAPCAVLALELAPLLGEPAPVPAFREVSRYPAVRRDVAVLVRRDLPAGEVRDAILQSGGDLFVSVDLFDRFEGPGIPDDKVSLAFRIVLQRPDRTLEEAEINKATERVRRMLEQRFQGELR
jgi:phenylalanyl-tRNA synthetase beta chain